MFYVVVILFLGIIYTIYLLITWYGKMSSLQIADKLKISSEFAEKTATELMGLGAFIDISETESFSSLEESIIF